MKNKIKWEKLIEKILIFAVSLIILAISTYADSWSSSQPSHGTLYADTITSKTDSSSVNIADSQGLFVTGDVTTLGRVGIGTTSPSTSLNVVGNNPSNPIAIFKQSHTSNLGTIVVDSPTDTDARPSNIEFWRGGNRKWSSGGVYNSDSFGVGTSSNLPDQKMVITTAGNVGIGTTSPNNPLAVLGTNTADQIIANFGGGGAANYQLRLTGGQNFDIRTVGTDRVDFEIADSPKLTIQAGGNVGIGMTSPASDRGIGRIVDIAGGATTGIKFRISTANKGKPEIYADSNGGLNLESFGSNTATENLIAFHTEETNSATSPTERMRIDSTGNVGIGTTGPTQKLQVSGGNIIIDNTNWYYGLNSGGAAQPLIRSRGMGYAPSSYPGLQIGRTGDSIALFIDPNSVTGGAFNGVTENEIFLPNAASFRQANSGGTDWISTMYFSNGNVGIGTTGPGTKLHVVGETFIQGAGNSGNTHLGRSDHEYISYPSTGNVYFRTYDGSTYDNKVIFTGGGNVGIGTTNPGYKLDVAGAAHATSFPTSSDARLKKNIVPLTNALQKLENIHGVKFEWNEKYKQLGRATNGIQIGIIAQELEKEFPELVTTWGNESYRAVDYGRFSAVLLEAVKELKSENNALKKRIEVLENK